jgi:hypothetical protein
MKARIRYTSSDFGDARWEEISSLEDLLALIKRENNQDLIISIDKEGYLRIEIYDTNREL